MYTVQRYKPGYSWEDLYGSSTMGTAIEGVKELVEKKDGCEYRVVNRYGEVVWGYKKEN